MRKIIAIILLLTLALTMTSCGASAKNPPQTAESSPVTQKSSSDSQASSTDADWPSELVGDLPKPDCKIDKVEKGKKGSITENATMIELSDMSKESAQKYIDTLKGQGFTSQVDLSVGEAIEFIGAKDDKSATVQVTYSTTTNKCSIIYTR